MLHSGGELEDYNIQVTQSMLKKGSTLALKPRLTFKTGLSVASTKGLMSSKTLSGNFSVLPYLNEMFSFMPSLPEFNHPRCVPSEYSQ